MPRSDPSTCPGPGRSKVRIVGLVNAIRGHERPKGILLGSFTQGRVATTYLFAGEEGIGKRLTALEFARVVNCVSPVEVSVPFPSGRREGKGLDACDRCSACRRFSTLCHPDLKIVEADRGVIKIDTVREVQEFLSLAPYEGGKKVVVMDDAECMNQAASNAFLKTLEEPPPHSLIILVSMSPERLLDTIRSRCFMVRFSPLAADECLKVISEKLPDADEESLGFLAEFAMGRPGVALKDEGGMVRERVDALIRDIERGGLSAKWKDRSEMQQWFSLLVVVLRDLAVMKSGAGGGLLVNRCFKDRIAAISGRMDLHALLGLYSEVIRLMDHFMFNLNVSIVANYVDSLFAGCGPGRA